MCEYEGDKRGHFCLNGGQCIENGRQRTCSALSKCRFPPADDTVNGKQRYICLCPYFYHGRYCEVDVSTSTAHRVGLILLLLFAAVVIPLAICLGVRYAQNK